MIVRSFQPEVQTVDSRGVWNTNALRFPTEAEALAWAKDLARRWTLVEAHRAVPSEDEPNYTFDGEEIHKL